MLLIFNLEHEVTLSFLEVGGAIEVGLISLM